MKTKFPPGAISILTSMLVPLLLIIGIGFPYVSLKDILFFLPTIFLLAGLPSLLLTAIASYFLKNSGASARSILFASIAIGLVIGLITLLPVLMTGGQ